MIQGWRRFGEATGVQEGDTVTIEMVSDTVLQVGACGAPGYCVRHAAGGNGLDTAAWGRGPGRATPGRWQGLAVSEAWPCSSPANSWLTARR